MPDPTVYSLNPTVLARFFTVAYIALFSVWGLSFNPRSRVNQTFFLMGLHALVWNLGTGFMLASKNPDLAESWYRSSYLGVAFISPGVLLFTSSLTDRIEQNRKLIIAGYLVSLAWAVEGLFGRFVIRGVWKTPWGFYPEYSTGGILFLAFFFLFMVGAFASLLQGLRTAVSKNRKKQIRLALVAFLIAYQGAWDFLPTARVAVYPFGFFPIILFITILWYANYRYQILNPSPEGLARKVLQTIGDSIIVLDLEGFIRLVNPKTEELLGCERAELVDQRIWALLDPQGMAFLSQRLGQLPGGNLELTTFSLNLRARDGTQVPFDCTLSGIRAWRGTVLGAVLACRDVRERIQKEQELTQSQERFRSLIENSSDLTTVLDASGRVLYESPSHERILGYTPEPLAGRNPFLMLHGDDADRVLRHFQKLLEEPGSSVMVEYRLRHRDGSLRYIESIAKNLLDDPVVEGVVINSRDITDRKKVEEELRMHRDNLKDLVDERTAVLREAMKQLRQEILERKRVEEERLQSEERFRSLVSNSSDVIVIVEPDGTRRYISPAVRQVLGYTPEELAGRSCMDNVHPDDAESVKAAFEQALRNPGTPQYVEYRVSHKDGSWRYFETIANNLIDNAALGAILACSRDTTKRKQDEQEIKKLNEELEQRVRERTADLEKAYEGLRELDRLKDSFLSTVSHEFRTPLTAIRSFSEILLRYEGVDSKTQRDFLEIINSESERLTRLVNNVLDLSRIKAGRMVWQDESLAMDELIPDVAKTHKRLLEERSLRITLVIAPNLPPVFADRDKIQQVLTNLLGNAIKFSNRQGEICVCAEAFEGRRFGETSTWIKVSVSDEGIGIEEKYFPIIFDHFRQIASDTLTDKPKGSGLGLPICKEIISHYGGNIWVESVKDRGSTFSFTLPAGLASESSVGNTDECIPAGQRWCT